ncbi:MAG: hypothetical protein V4635_08425 [Bacteroidota bacterium]
MFSFCKPVSSKKRFLPFRKLDDNFSFTLFEKADAVPQQQWKSITGDSVFLQRDYLKIVEAGRHTKLMARYVIVYHQAKPCGIIYFQVVDFKAEVFGEILEGQVDASGSKRLKIFENYLGANKDEVLLRLFTCGNNLVSGEYGFIFDSKTPQEQASALLLNITEVISKEDRLKGGLSAILIKDFHEPLQPEALYLEEKYSSFHVEPNLIVEIPPGVHSLEEYIALFSKKYRNRAKSIFKSVQSLQQRQLEQEEIKNREKEIYTLYEEVFEKAKFRLIKLPATYFSEVKAVFKTQFNIRGIFMNGELVAFSSSFLMPDGSLEAHYIGFKYELNHELNLYQNILYSLLNEAIQNKRTRVNLGRTAAEIKTTVGARPEDLICYIKPQNTISRIIQKPFIGLLQPAEWIPRNPFKEEGSEKSNDAQPMTKR